MKITFSDGSYGHFKLHHQYKGEFADRIKEATMMREKYIETVRMLKKLEIVADGTYNPALVAWFEEQILYLKGIISEAMNCPSKTLCSFEWFSTDGIRRQVIEAFSKISEEDASAGLHNRKRGREAAIRNLIVALQEKEAYGGAKALVMPKYLRRELFEKLLGGVQAYD